MFLVLAYNLVASQECGQPCKTRLSCGHRCPKKCYEECISVSGCLQPCGRQLECGHKCLERCSNPCTTQCQKACKKELACGHPCVKMCYEDCITPSQCEAMTDFPCPDFPEEHKIVRSACNSSEQEVRANCKYACRRQLKCGHDCKNLCGQQCTTDSWDFIQIECEIM